MRLTRVSTFIAIAGAIGVPAAIAATASASPAPGVSWAYGVSAVGLVNVPQTPQVSSLKGPRDKSLAELPPNPLVKLKVLHTSATPGRSRAGVVDLKVATAALSAHLVTARCDGGRGSSHLVKASLAGHRLAVDAAPNSTVAVPVAGLGTVSVVLNKQTRGADGSLTVTAIEVKLTLATGQAQAIDVSSATCSAGTPTVPTPTPSPTRPGTTPPSAPVPTPVPTDLPVTG
ncbi:MAG: choice-of-anchor P family protein [Actinoallomurus sp.]